MKMYIGVTDPDWFQILKSEQCEEVNFWTPSARNFRALEPNDLFLFKLHHPDNYIVGGGYFVKQSILPTYLAWEAFGIENGTHSLKELNDRILKYRKPTSRDENDLQIGCIILTDVFFFDREDWIPAPEDWSKNIVQGKTYSTDQPIGQRIYDEVLERLESYPLTDQKADILPEQIAESGNRYTYSETKHRIGQGAFRVLVTDAYQRRCAITGERTLPVLEAAHIKPYSQNGQNNVNNGLLLRSDFHILYDQGYITVDKDLRVDVSRHLNEDYGNGKDYYKYHGEKLMILPEDTWEMPSTEMLEWHNENVFLG